MTCTPDELLKLIHETGALSIWDRKKGPVFWYIAGVPGPFYVNTEWLLGKKPAQNLLTKIDEILTQTEAHNPATRVVQLTALVLKAYESDPTYQKIVETMAERAKKDFPMRSFTFVSGGERRDWLFSIPFAKICDLKHIFMFKNKTIYCEQPLQTEEAGLHVSDLINNAVSYTDMWLPVLEKAGLKCAATMCVISRGSTGLQALQDKGIKVVALNHIDLDFFQRSQVGGLITPETFEEISTHFASPKDWAEKYLLSNTAVFNAAPADNKSPERMRSFFANDPWSLRPAYADFFAKMQEKTK